MISKCYSSVTKQNLYYATVEAAQAWEAPNQTQPCESAVQAATSSLISHLTTLETGLSALVMLLAGPLSDQHGRKLEFMRKSFAFIS